jgi:nucleoid-associated protein YgaU
MYVLIPDAEVLHQRYPQLTGGGGEAEPAPPGYFVDQSGQPCYRVGKGDTLTEIAEQYLGRSSRWVQVYGMNKDRIPDVNSLKIGAVLRLPADATQVVLAPGGSELR